MICHVYQCNLVCCLACFHSWFYVKDQHWINFDFDFDFWLYIVNKITYSSHPAPKNRQKNILFLDLDFHLLYTHPPSPRIKPKNNSNNKNIFFIFFWFRLFVKNSITQAPPPPPPTQKSFFFFILDLDPFKINSFTLDLLKEILPCISDNI